jgi:NAD+ synthase (glutamine-hydrolysing)
MSDENQMLLTLCLAQINLCVGDLEGNAAAMKAAADAASDAGADLVVFPELAVSGYPPEDLVLKPHFLADCYRAVQELVEELPLGIAAIIGLPMQGSERACNAALVATRGQVHLRYDKQLLPNYGVFDEKRVFEAGDHPGIFDFSGWRIALHICEDSWYPGSEPFASLDGVGIDALVNLSASPYHAGKHGVRQDIVREAASRVGAPVAYCNLVGGQDELVFDGRSLVCSSAGEWLASGAGFKEELVYVTLSKAKLARSPASSAWPVVEIPHSAVRSPEASSPIPLPGVDPLQEVYAGLSLGLRDYVEKNGFKKVLIAISGGVDSALVTSLAVDALGADRVVGVSMPTRFNSAGTIQDAETLAQTLGIEFSTVPIQSLFERYLEELSPLWPDRELDVTEENLQARIRGNMIMALSNKFGYLVLTTGNKSELAMGYCTLYGDMAGGFAVIKDVPKTLVFELCRWRNREGEVIPDSTITRPPSAELRDDQKDSDSLPPYDVLDPILEAFVEGDLGLEEVVMRGFDEEQVRRVMHLVDVNEYKRRQAPPGIKITPKAFGRDRRVPITNRYRSGKPIKLQERNSG